MGNYFVFELKEEYDSIIIALNYQKLKKRKDNIYIFVPSCTWDETGMKSCALRVRETTGCYTLFEKPL